MPTPSPRADAPESVSSKSSIVTANASAGRPIENPSFEEEEECAMARRARRTRAQDACAQRAGLWEDPSDGATAAQSALATVVVVAR